MAQTYEQTLAEWQQANEEATSEYDAPWYTKPNPKDYE